MKRQNFGILRGLGHRCFLRIKWVVSEPIFTPLCLQTYFYAKSQLPSMLKPKTKRPMEKKCDRSKPALRRFAAVSPFCFGYPAQPDIASWRIRIIHNHFDQPTLFFATRRQGRYPRSLEAFFFTPVDFLSVSRHDARAPLERTKDVDFIRVQLSTDWSWCLKARNGSGGNVDFVDRSTSSLVGAWSIFWTSPELFSAVVSVIFPFLCWWTWGMSSRSFTTEEVDSSTRLLLEQTTSTSTPRCRSGEYIHNQPVSFSLAVLYLNLHFRCLALMQENDQSSVTAEADGLQLDSAFGVTSGVTSQKVEGRTEPSLKVNCFYTDMKQLHLHRLKKSFMLYQCTVHGGLRFSVQEPRTTDFFLTMSLWSSKSMFFFFFFIKPHASQPGCLGWWMSFVFAKVNVLSITFWWLPEDLQSTTY